MGQVFVSRGDDHAVRHTADEILDVAGPDPDGRAYGRSQFFCHDCRQSLAASFFQTLHGQDEGQGRGEAGFFQLMREAAQLLGADGDDADIGCCQSCRQVRSQVHRIGQAQVFILAGVHKFLQVLGTGTAP